MLVRVHAVEVLQPFQGDSRARLHAAEELRPFHVHDCDLREPRMLEHSADAVPYRVQIELVAVDEEPAVAAAVGDTPLA